MYGNGLRPDVWPRFRDRFGIPVIAEMFGSTESMVGFINPARGGFLMGSIGHHGGLQRWRLRKTYVSVAVDYDTGEVRRDPKTNLAIRTPLEEGGELLVAVPSKTAFGGYVDNAKATESKFVTNVLRPGDVFYRTGDALRRDSDGRWFFVDRLGDTFRWRSENVSTAEVSAVIGKYPAIVDANVVGVAVPGHEGRAGCAALLLEGGFLDFDGLLKYGLELYREDLLICCRHMQKDLPRYAIPVFLRLVKEPSLNNTHKQSKTQIREEGVDPNKTGDDPLYILLDNSYVPYTRQNWDLLRAGKLKL
jgi:acyl-CoA synthetase (AMP-forming)/AMP-acid ligase II